MVKILQQIKWKFHKFLLNRKKEKLELMTLTIVNTNADTEPLIKEGMWYSDIAIMLSNLKYDDYIEQIGEDTDLTLRLTEKGIKKLNGKT